MSNFDPPSYLETPPSSPSVSPPVDTRLQDLPFGELSWENFERLCLRLVRTEADVEDCRLYGERGDDQGGIDLYARGRNSDRYKLYQCKRVENFGPAKIKEAVSTFLEGDWKDDADSFVLCTSESLRSAERSDEVENQRDRLEEKNIEFKPWDLDELSERMKNYPKIVDDFFGRPYVESFNGREAAESLGSRLDVKDVEEFRDDLGSFYGSVFHKHDPGLQGPGYRTLEPLPIEERFVLPDIVDQHSISFDEEAVDTEASAEEEEQLDFDSQLIDQRYSEYGEDYYEGRDQERNRQRSSTEATYESRQTVEDWLVQSEKSIVLGGPGTGKSALLRFVILDLLREAPTLQKLAQKWGNKLPVWVPFGRWTRMIANSSGPRGSLLELLEQWFRDWEEEASWLSVQRALEDDRLLLLVDGLDEWSNQSAASIALQRLQVFIEQRDLPAVLTSRPQGFKRLEFGETDWQIGKIAGFSRDQQSELANVWFKHWHALRSADSDTEKIEKRSREDVETLMRDLRKSRDLAELAEIPLLLSLLIYLRYKQTRLPENRFKAYKTLVQKLVTEHPKQRRRAAEITQDLFPELTDDEVTEIFASLAFSIQKENPEGLIEKEEAHSLLWDMLEDPEQGLGMSRDKARRTSNKILEIGQSTLGLLVRQSQTQVGFFHRSFLHYLAALHLSRKPREEQIELIREHCTDPQWREVILSLFFLTRRRDDIETYVENLRSSYKGPASRRSVESLLSEVAFGPFKSSPNLARELATQTFERIETGGWMPHRSELLETTIRGLRSSKTADAVRERIKEWFPSHNRWRESLFQILANSSRSDRVVEFCLRGLHDEEVKNQRSAATALADLRGGEDSIAQQLFDVVEGGYNSDVRASGLEALVEGWLSLDRTESLVGRMRQHTAPQIRLMSIKGTVLLGTQNESGYSEILDILDGRSFGWGRGMDDLLIEGWSELDGLMKRCMNEIRRPGGSRVP
jgi:DNA replication protein DnaC